MRASWRPVCTRGNLISSDVPDLLCDAVEASVGVDRLEPWSVSSAATETPANEAAIAAFTKPRRDVLYFNGNPLFVLD